MSNKTVSNRLIRKIIASFLLLILFVGICYMLLTFYFTSKYFEETTQRLNASVAEHLVNEKFGSNSPFLEDGTINKPLFGDIMHEMMAVNRAIEVYLLDNNGGVLYSVVLDHDQPNKPLAQINLAPVTEFLNNKGQKYLLGDDPRNSEKQKIFSVAPFESNGKKGFIYIILAGKTYEEVTSSLFGSYFIKLGFGASIATVIFAGLLGVLLVWYLTKNLREIIETTRRFKEGDLDSRIKNPENSDLSILGTTYNEMADTIVANIEELKSVESLRRELIANVSHDLRTPLAVMQGYIETLQIKKEELTEDQRIKYLEIVQKNIFKLSELIQQLFEYSKLEARQIEPKKEPFSISDLAHDVLEKYQNMADSKGISIKLKLEENLPVVFADIGLVERVIQNLMDNALKFTPRKGEIILGLRSNKKEVLIMVKDSGPGISAEDQQHIFERFKQAPTIRNAKAGAGLGLAIVKKIIEIHKSTVKVISQPNKGATFQFNLPLHTG